MAPDRVKRGYRQLMAPPDNRTHVSDFANGVTLGRDCRDNVLYAYVETTDYSGLSGQWRVKMFDGKHMVRTARCAANVTAARDCMRRLFIQETGRIALEDETDKRQHHNPLPFPDYQPVAMAGVGS